MRTDGTNQSAPQNQPNSKSYNALMRDAQREWMEHIVEYSDRNHISVFMKESLRGLMGDDFRQEFPWEV